MGKKLPILDKVVPGSKDEQEQILKNARSMALDQAASDFMPGASLRPSPELMSLFPGKSWEEQAPVWNRAGKVNEYKAAVEAQKKTDPNTMAIDRSHINKQLMNSILKAQYPEMYQNLQMTEYANGDTSRPKDKNLEYDVNAYRRRIIQDLTGQELKPEQIVPTQDPNAYGYYDPNKDQMELRDIKDMATPVHESLHRKILGPDKPEKLQELLNSQNLTQDLNATNAGHIDYTNPTGLQGEAGFLYQKLQELLNKK